MSDMLTELKVRATRHGEFLQDLVTVKGDTLYRHLSKPGVRAFTPSDGSDIRYELFDWSDE